MKKMNAAELKNNFVINLNALGVFYTTTSAALTLDSQRTFLTENSLMAAAVLWEGFVSDLLVTYINVDSTRFATHLKDALESELSAKQLKILHKYAPLNVPSHLTKAEILDLVDGNGNNITFSHFGELVNQAKSWLTDVDAKKFRDCGSKQKAAVNALISIRNHLAHRSDRSHRAMNDALTVGQLHTLGLKRGAKNITHVGAYLKSIVAVKGITRLEVFLEQLRVVAATI